MKNVLHVIETGGPGGAETIFVELASRLDRARFAPTCVVVREGWVSQTLRARGIDPVIIPTRKGSSDLPFLAALTRLVRRRRIDFIQSHLFGANFYSRLAGLPFGVPVFGTFHGTVDLGRGGLSARIKMRVVAGARRLIFVSESLRRAVLAETGVAASRTTVIHNGIDTEAYAPRPASRSNLGLPADAIVVGAIGNIRRPKAYDALLRVAALCAADRRLHFVIAGEESAELMPGLRALAAELGVGSHVRFLGFRDDVATLLNACDIYLSTSRSEGFSLTTVQAMATALPVIATRCGGPEEIVTDGVEGTLHAVDDLAALAAAVRTLAASPEQRARLGAHGRRTAIERFSMDRMVGDYAALYEAAAG